MHSTQGKGGNGVCCICPPRILVFDDKAAIRGKVIGVDGHSAVPLVHTEGNRFPCLDLFVVVGCGDIPIRALSPQGLLIVRDGGAITDRSSSSVSTAKSKACMSTPSRAGALTGRISHFASPDKGNAPMLSESVSDPTDGLSALSMPDTERTLFAGKRPQPASSGNKRAMASSTRTQRSVVSRVITTAISLSHCSQPVITAPVSVICFTGTWILRNTTLWPSDGKRICA